MRTSAESGAGGELPPAAEARPAPLLRPRAVRRRDGREVPFDPARIAEAVRRTQDAVGEVDPPFAQEVADVVSLALAARAGLPLPDGAAAPVPDVEQVQDLVERALVEMGRAALAKAYILARERRARAREALTLLERPDRSGRLPWVRDGAGTAPWNGARIVAALVEEAELPREIAEEVAERVETRVVDAGLRRLSTSLVREFVDNELMAMGLETALHRQEPVGLPRHDLRQLLARRGPAPGEAAPDAVAGAWRAAPDDLDRAVAGGILARYTLADVLDERSADLHKGGALHVEDVEHPHLVLARAVPAALLARGEPSPRAAFALLGELAPLLAGTRHGVVLEGLHAVAAPLLRGTRSAAGLRELLAAFGALGAAAGRRLDLSAPGGRGAALAGRLVRELAGLAAEGVAAPRLFLAWDELAPALEDDPTTADAAEALLAAGGLVPVWHARDERWAAPGCRRRRRENGALACAGAVALNLPRLARQAGPWREDLLYEALAARLQSALDVLESLDAFQRRHAAARTELLRERRGFALVPVGLAEALRILGDGELRPGQGARLLGLAAEGARRFGEERGLAVVLSPFFGEAAGARLARADARIPRVSQPRLFTDLPAPEEQRDRPYRGGYVLPGPVPTASGGAAPGLAQAELCATVRCGALPALPVPDDEARAPRPALDVWRRFHEERSRRRREGDARARRAAEAGAGPLFRPGLR